MQRQLACAHTWTQVVAVVSALYVSASQNTFANDLPQLTVLPWRGTCLSLESRETLNDLLVNSIDRLQRYQVMGLQEINMLLGVERLKDIAGCDTTTCLAEIMGALGAPFFVTGTVHEINSQLYFSLVLIDATHNRVLSRAQVNYTDDEYFFAYAIDDVVKRLFEKQERGATPEIAALPVPVPTTLLMTANRIGPGLHLRIISLEHALNRRFQPSDVLLLRTCDSLETELLTTDWGVNNVQSKEHIEGQIRAIRQTLGLAQNVQWPPRESCF